MADRPQEQLMLKAKATPGPRRAAPPRASIRSSLASGGAGRSFGAGHRLPRNCSLPSGGAFARRPGRYTRSRPRGWARPAGPSTWPEANLRHTKPTRRLNGFRRGAIGSEEL